MTCEHSVFLDICSAKATILQVFQHILEFSQRLLRALSVSAVVSEFPARKPTRAREVYKLLFSHESEKKAEEMIKLLEQFSERDVDRKEEIAELCREAYSFLETLSRRRHERREDVQVILGQLRLENRQRIQWVSSMPAKLRADERTTNYANYYTEHLQ